MLKRFVAALLALSSLQSPAFCAVSAAPKAVGLSLAPTTIGAAGAAGSSLQLSAPSSLSSSLALPTLGMTAVPSVSVQAGVAVNAARAEASAASVQPAAAANSAVAQAAVSPSAAFAQPGAQSAPAVIRTQTLSEAPVEEKSASAQTKTAAKAIASVRANAALSDALSGRDAAANLGKFYHGEDASGEAAVAAQGTFDAPTAEPAVGSDSWIQARFLKSPRGLVFARFRAGEYKPEYDERAKALGADIVYIRRPSRKELETYGEEQDFYLKPRWVRWVRPAQTVEEMIASIPAKNRTKLKKNLSRGEAVPVEVKALNEEDYAAWHKIYMDEVVGKPGGRMHVGPDWVKDMPEAKRRLWHIILFRSPATGEVIGGALMAERPDFGILSVGFAAYRAEAKEHSVSYRAMALAMLKARELGYKNVSAGADTNLYGYDYNLGLLGWKAENAMIPYPEEPFELMKVVNSGKFAEVADGEGRKAGYFFHALRREGEFYRRYLEAADEQPGRDTEEGFHLKLLGGTYFEPGTPAPEAVLEGRHFYFDDVSIKTPNGLEVIRKPAK